MVRILRWHVFAIIACIVCMPLTMAQAENTPINADFISAYGLRNLENAVVIHASPATPAPGQTIHFVAESPIYDLSKSDIRWIVNGGSPKEGAGLVSTDVVVDSLGSPVDVTVVATDPVWGTATDEIVITPLQVDILFDAPTYVPPFYKGRSLAGAGGVVRLQAVAHFTKEDGGRIPDRDITYTWKRNGTVLGSLSGLGKSNIVIDAPALYGSDQISLRASAREDTIAANTSIQIQAAEPVLALYQDHPLFGVMYRQALASQTLTQNDLTVSAIPYFAPASSLRDSTLIFSWQLDNKAITASSTKKNSITIRPDADLAHLHVEVTDALNFFFSTAGSWAFTGNTSRYGNVTNPNTPDAFHNSEL